MIVQFLISACLNLIAFIFSTFNVTIPTEITDALEIVKTYVADGVRIVKFYYPPGYIEVLANFLITFINMYLVIIFIKKIIDIIPWGKSNSNGY